MPADRDRPAAARLDMDAETMPQEAGINERAVSFTKGCYVGQETVARLHYKGKPNRHLRGLRLAGAGRARRRDPARRARSWAGSARRCVSPRLGPIALALVRREAEPGDEVAGGRRDAPSWSSCPSAVTERRDAHAAGSGLAGDEPAARRPAHRRGRRRGAALDLPGYDARSGRSTCRRSAAEPEPARAAPARSRRRAGPRGRRLGPLASASSTCVEPLLDFYYRYWFRVEVEGIENVPAEGGALLVSNHSGALPPDAPDDHAGDPPRAPAPAARSTCSASTGSRAIPGVGHADQQDRARGRPPRQRAAPAARRGPARARLPRGPEGIAQALLAALPAAPLRPRRLRAHGACAPGVPIVPIARRRAPRRRCRSSPTCRCCSGSPGSSTSRSTTPSRTSASPRR